VKFLPTSDADRREMLAAIGVSSVDDLFASIPAEVRKPADLPPPLSEIEVRRMLGGLASRNANARETAFFLGAGIYHHWTSAVADQMLYRAEWLTSYTPYQPEVSQGTLQSIFEFQTHICLLTGLDVANASLYEGASALVEALLMASRLSRGRKKAVLSAAIHPEYRETVRTYFAPLGLVAVEVPIGADGATDPDLLAAAVDDDTFGVAVQSPNFYGVVESWETGSRAAHDKGALSVAVVAEAISMGLLAPPGERGADIACGEGQALGVPMHFGGPVLGFLACRSDHQRQIPGRLVGETRDAEGRRAFCLTLSTREQHIRRERATSNICTNQGLMALAANIHCSLLGKRGLREVAVQSHAKAEYLKEAIAGIAGYRLPLSGPTFNEFTVEAPRAAAPLLGRLAKRGILAGVPLSRWETAWPNRFLVAATEMNTRDEMDRLVTALSESEGAGGRKVPRRESP
jgi:glycine dehydrogenase subunit 1